MLILASKSPRRIELLSGITKDFLVIPADIDESFDKNLPPRQIAADLAFRKALCVFNRRGGTVLGADTIVVCGGEILNKPSDFEDAKRMLKKLSGNIHSVFTGVCLITDTKIVKECCETKVEFYKLSDRKIIKYITKFQPYDKAGAYGIQDGFRLVKGITGSESNVIGLPLELVKSILSTI